MNIFDLEHNTMLWLRQQVGYENSVLIEDFFMVVVTFLAGYVIGQLRLVSRFRSNYFLTDKLTHLVFQRNKHKDIVQYYFRTPKKLLDKFDLLIGLRMANRNKYSLSVVNAKWYSRLAFALLIFLIICLILAISFMINVVSVDDLKETLADKNMYETIAMAQWRN